MTTTLPTRGNTGRSAPPMHSHAARGNEGKQQSLNAMPDSKTKKPLSLSAQIIIGIALGLALGLFFGEWMEPLNIVGKAFIQLLQMAVLPYVMISLISGLGRLNLSDAKVLAAKVGMLLLIAWAIAFFVILVVSLAFPPWTSASFFSSASIAPIEKPDLLSLYIPANPFHSLAANLVPAVVLFSIAVGLALIGVEKKDGLLDILSTLTKALTQVTNFVVRLSPYGIFALTAAAAGTMSVDEFSRLQVYFYAIIAGSLLAGLWILPGLIAALTPFKYRDILDATRDALLTAFTTGNLFVVLPILAEASKDLFEKNGIGDPRSDSMIDIIIPVSFNFPNVGKLMMLTFMLFAAWYAGTDLSISQYGSFVVSGLVTFFGSVNVAIPFLLDMLRIPADMFELFLVSTLVNTRFSTLVAAMHVVFLGVAGTAAITGHLKFNLPKLIRFGVITLGLTVLMVIGGRLYLGWVVDANANTEQIVRSMKLQGVIVSARVYRERPKLELPKAGAPRMPAILKRKSVRIGYIPDRVPYSYFNEDNELVGLGVNLMHRLAYEMEVDLEFVPTSLDTLKQDLDSGLIDSFAGGLQGATTSYAQVTYSDPIMDLTLAFVTKDYRRETFSSWLTVRATPGLTIALADGPATSYFQNRIKDVLPLAKVIVLDNDKDFFTDPGLHADAMLETGETGSAWTLLYPSHTVVIPTDPVIRLPVSLPVPSGDVRLARFLSQWIDLKKGDHTIDRLYDYWILGKNAVPKEPRWSIMRDVLGWGK